MKQKMVAMRTISMVAMLLFCGIFVGVKVPQKAMAKSYQKVESYGKTVKAGSYYFKIDSSGVYYGKSSSSLKVIKSAMNTSNCYTDGKILWCLYEAKKTPRIGRFNLKNGKMKFVKKLPYKKSKSDQDAYSIESFQGDYMYIYRGSFESWKHWLCVYNVKKKTWKQYANVEVMGSIGKYAFVSHDYRTDVSPVKGSLYTISGDQVTKIKEIGNYVTWIGVYKKQFLYAEYTTNTMEECNIYKLSKDGKTSEKIGSFHGAESESSVYAYLSEKKNRIVINLGNTVYYYNLSNGILKQKK